MDILQREFDAIRRRNFELDFRYPTKTERERMRIVHRRAERRLQTQNKRLADLVQALEEGRISPADIPVNLRGKLKQLLR